MTVLTTTVTALPAGAGPRVPGIDVSKYQGRIDWRAVATSPVRFAILRATLGHDYRDARYARNLSGATRNGIVVGAYHYAKPSLGRGDARAEANHYLEVARVRAGDVVPVLDIEETGGLSTRQLRNWAQAWLRLVYLRTGVRAMIYSGNAFWRGFMRNSPWFARRGHDLWVAHWYVGSPHVPGRRWAGRGFTVWQFSASGRIDGIRGPVDRDWMRGSLERGTIASIVVRPADGGVISGHRIGCGGRLGWCTRLANPGEEIRLRASPERGLRLIRWTGACAHAGEDRACTLRALGDETVSAVFGPVERSVAPAPAPSPGSPSPEAEQESAPEPSAETPPVTDMPVPTSPEAVAELTAPARGTSLGRPGGGEAARSAWKRERERRSIGGTFRWERRPSASISFAFRGGSVTLFTARGRGMGLARISIDGTHVKTIDGYARRFRPSVRHRFEGLGDGAHVLTIAPLGRKHRAATDRRVVVDALRWRGRLHADPKPDPSHHG